MTTYDIIFKSGKMLQNVSAETAFQATVVPEVRYVQDHECGNIVWGCLQFEDDNKPAEPVKPIGKVSDITRTRSWVITEQYETPILIPICNEEWAICVQGDNIHPRVQRINNKKLAMKFFESDRDKLWGNDSFYTEVRLYCNNKVFRLASYGFEEFHDWEWEYKNAYLNNLTRPSQYHSNELEEVERICVDKGLTDIVLFRAKQQCDQLYKLYNRGLVSECNANILESVFM